MMNSIKKLFSLLLIAVFAGSFLLSCKDDDPEPKSAEKDILTFQFAGLTPPVDGTISGTNITATVPYDVALNSLVPTITISPLASIQPAGGVARDFSTPQTYTVTAEDGTEKVYTVTVTAEAPPQLVATPLWQRNLAQGGLPSWFTANNDREIAVHGEYAYIHNNNDKIRVVSAATGEDVTAGTEGFIDGKKNFASGNLFLLGTDTDSQGRIIASNLRNGSADLHPWNVYKWNSKDAEQELLFQYPTPAEFRLGENISVVGDVAGNAMIYVPGSGFGYTNNKVLKFTITNGQANLTPQIITLEGVTSLGNAPDVSPVSDGANANIIVAGTGIGNIAEYTQAGALVGKLPDALKDVEETKMLFSFALSVEAFTIQDRNVVAAMATDYTVGGAGPADNGYLYLIDYTDGWSNVTADNIIRIPFTPAGNIDKNVNATGGVSVVMNANGTATVYGMLTNFGIGAYTVTFQ